MQTPGLTAALDQLGEVLTVAASSDATRSTPCVEWDVSHLVDHLMLDLEQFRRMAEGEQPNYSAAPEHVPQESWLTTYATRRDQLEAAWARADEGMPDLQVTEFAVHTWDLAQAVGGVEVLDDDLAEHALTFMKGMLTPERRGDSFAAEQPTPADAAPYERLAAFAGRAV